MIYIECKPDYVLVNTLTKFPRKEIIHEFKGKFEVCKRLEAMSDSRGLIDEDPASIQPAYMKGLILANDFAENDIKVFGDSRNNNNLIVLCPRLEEWILKSAREAGIDVRDYSLPNDAKKLHEEINISLEKLEKLLADLKNSSNRLKTLKRLLEK